MHLPLLVRKWLSDWRPSALTVALGLLAGGCSTTNPYFDPAKPHHRPDGFANRFAPEGPPSQGGFWRWQWERLWTTVVRGSAGCGPVDAA